MQFYRTVAKRYVLWRAATALPAAALDCGSELARLAWVAWPPYLRLLLCCSTLSIAPANPEVAHPPPQDIEGYEFHVCGLKRLFLAPLTSFPSSPPITPPTISSSLLSLLPHHPLSRISAFPTPHLSSAPGDSQAARARPAALGRRAQHRVPPARAPAT